MGYTGSSDGVAALIAFLGNLWLFGLGLSVLMLASYWKLFKKAGEPGWAIFVPFYNVYVMYKIAFGNGWLFLLLLVPVANIIMAILLPFKFAGAYGKGIGYGFGLLFVPVVFYPVIAFGDAHFCGAENAK